MFELKENFSLKNHNTFGIHAKSKYFVSCSSETDLIEFLNIHETKELPLMVLGGGSNVLFTEDFNGYILHPNIKGIEIKRESDKEIEIKVGAGEDWDELVAYCVEKGWGGLENLSLIPGNVGTCPIQNIGAYGVEVKDTITLVETIDIQSLKKNNYNNAQCEFAYRDSIFKRKLKGKQIITYVHFKLKKQPDFKLEYGNLKLKL
jgi:UDP-N-acetylmuramate dehydrogenase